MATKATGAPLGLASEASCGCGSHDGNDGRKAVAVDPDVKDRNLKRLRRIEGQVRGLQKMVDEDRYCADIMTQISSVHEALRCAITSSTARRTRSARTMGTPRRCTTSSWT